MTREEGKFLSGAKVLAGLAPRNSSYVALHPIKKTCPLPGSHSRSQQSRAGRSLRAGVGSAQGCKQCEDCGIVLVAQESVGRCAAVQGRAALMVRAPAVPGAGPALGLPRPAAAGRLCLPFSAPRPNNSGEWPRSWAPCSDLTPQR